jgi:dynein heavy chain
MEKNHWKTTGMSNEDLYIWNHSAVEVEAVPAWKYFVFGGSSTVSFDEVKPRERAKCIGDVFVCDIDNKSKILEVKIEDNFKPEPREDSSMLYYRPTKSLLIFGGRNNEWLGDLYSLSVQSIVGPTYSVNSLSPNMGRISGQQTIKIFGSKLTAGQIYVYFIGVGKFKSVMANFINENEAVLTTPNFTELGPREVEVRISIDVPDELSTNLIKFNIYEDTKADKSLFFGPACLDSATHGVPTCFYIRARNKNNENRNSGLDEFIVTIVDNKNKEPVNCEITDLNNGTYKVEFTAPSAGEYKISVALKEDNNKQLNIRDSPIIVNFDGTDPKDNEIYGPNMLNKFLRDKVEFLEKSMNHLIGESSTKKKNLNDINTIIAIKNSNKEIEVNADSYDCKINQLLEYFKLFELDKKKQPITLDRIRELLELHAQMLKTCDSSRSEITPKINDKTEEYKDLIKQLGKNIVNYNSKLKTQIFATNYAIGPDKAFKEIEQCEAEIDEYQKTLELYENITKNLGIPEETIPCNKSLENLKTDLKQIKYLWSFIKESLVTFDEFKDTKWPEIDGGAMDEKVAQGITKKFNQVRRDAAVYKEIIEAFNKDLNRWKKLLPIITALRGEMVKERHWEDVREKINTKDLKVDEKLFLKTFYDLQIELKGDEINEICERAVNEDKMDKKLKEIKANWLSMVYSEKAYPRATDIMLLDISEDNYAILEDNMQHVQTMSRNRFNGFFKDEINKWKLDLNAINDVHVSLKETQNKWTFLESLFLGSDEIKKELPQDTEKFVQIDKEVREILKKGNQIKNILNFSTSKFGERTLFDWLKDLIKRLEACERSLNIFMDNKKTDFPRFYFISSVDLLDILSNGNNPSKVNKHISKVILAIDKLELTESKGDRPSVKGMHTRVGIEYVPFFSECKMLGKVEDYLALILSFMQQSLKYIARQSLKDYHTMNQLEWIEKNPSQIALLSDLIVFVERVESSLANLQTDPKALDKLAKMQEESLTNLIKTVMKNLTEETMAKVMVLIKLETHSRDVIIEKLIGENVTTSEAFQWQSQLKAYWSKTKDDCHLNVCDAEFEYGYEYLGNGDRLVVTPLTDRIYVTATQALHLKMGCAPAGPAGTGKTETTKDLASAMGKACYVFNCSDQMRYKGMGEIFMGLASSGSWGCFDEFNRLVPEVLSVCAMQFKSIVDALRKNDKEFKIEEKVSKLVPSCGVFITMNPGYLGRSELPEGLKSLFRPITVVVPDFKMISENCLMAQGFVEAKMLAEKFVVLYSLCANLLSKQRHYDWGLRAIKSVLVVAGAFKRADPDIQEIQLLKRALRDFNVPKIVKDDMPIFSGLIGDLFPNVNVERKRDMKFEAKILDACLAVNEKKLAKGMDESDAVPTFKLTSDENFVLKIVQLKELIEIRHSVFIMGNAGCGKTSTWRVLAKTFELTGQKTETKDLNPKSISSDDLYGKYTNLQTREFKYGILSSIMKTMAASEKDTLRWIILDGDLDANWIENMNSVMDDNKVLTLPNNDRIDLLPNMRLMFEIRDLLFATPATVSRAGILYISDEDGYQWKSYIKSWIEQMRFRKPIEQETSSYFKKFLEPCLDFLKASVGDKLIVSSVFPITYTISLCKLLEAYVDRKEACVSKNPKMPTKSDEEKYIGYDHIFCFCTLWACGAILTEKDGQDYRKLFGEWFRGYFKEYKFPAKGSVFDYYYDVGADKFEEWTKKIKVPEYKGENIKYVTVPTSETVSISELMESLLTIGHPSLLIGNAGCGKTQICKGMLEVNRKRTENTNNTFSYAVVNFNYYTDTYMMQNTLVANTEKLMQRTFVPKGNPKMMAIFIDDLNMQMLDKCNTQNAIELVRQFMDYKHIYECSKMELMEFINIQFVAAMNPTAGSFNINPRLQRHFWISAIPFPSDNSLVTVYSFFLNGHFKPFNMGIVEFINSKVLIQSSLLLHKAVYNRFKKSAQNFHYDWNIRHITGVFQGILSATTERYTDPEKLVKMWVHENDRVYGDRLVTTQDLNMFRLDLLEIVKKNFGKYVPSLGKYFSEKNPESLVFCRFTNGHTDNLYDLAASIDDVRNKANVALSEYNDSIAGMELVLFEDATKHVCRITRIISQPSGHGLLVGVGGSGKQSLSKLSAYICQYAIKMITISQEYKLVSFKDDLQKMYNICGTSEDSGILFILTEGQIIDEKFMVPVNDLLSSGEVQDLFNNDDKETIINKVRPACKSQTGKDSPTDVWNFFIGRVKKNLHMSICFSPGDNLRIKSRKFPAIVNTTVIDWFQPWPEEALYKVGRKELEKLEDLKALDYFDAVIGFMPYSFKIVGDKAKEMLDVDRRYTYVTPKSFLELIKLFTSMYVKKFDFITNNKSKLEAGLQKLKEAKEAIAKLEIELQVQSVEIGQIRVEAEKNDQEATAKAIIVKGEADIAEGREKEVSVMKAKIQEEQEICLKELEQLKPLMIEAEAACKKLEDQPKLLEDMKSVMKNPPGKIQEVVRNLLIMVAGQPGFGINVEVDKSNMPKSVDNTALGRLLLDFRLLRTSLLQFCQNIKEFKYNPKNFDNVIAKANPAFFDTNKEIYEKNKKDFTSAKAANGELYIFVYNIYHYYYSAKTVEPKQRALDDKVAELQAAEIELAEIQSKVGHLKEELAIVMKAKKEAEDKLNEAVRKENECKEKLDLAKRFTNALGSSSERWTINIKDYETQLQIIIGDILIAAAFVSYCGPFPEKYRRGIKASFFDFVHNNNIPYSPNAKNPLSILTNEAEIARWNNEKLPADPVSVENGAIFSASERWSLLIDPQLQGIKWLREKEKANGLHILRMNDKKLMNTLGECIEGGNTLMIENLGNMIDATLSPVISRSKKKVSATSAQRAYELGNNLHIIHKNFKFILHTKLSNPHYPPEIQAECTLINFTVTEDGLENQLLALIVKLERPLLARKKEEVIQEQNQGKIKLLELEEGILTDLNTPGDLLENKALIVSLENSKEVSEKVSVSMKIAKEAEVEINRSSDAYRPAAGRGSLIFFLMSELYKLHTFYLYSLESYIFVIRRAVASVQAKWKEMLKRDEPEEEKKEGEQPNPEEGANDKIEKKDEPEEKEDDITENQRIQRVQDLTHALTEFSFQYVRRGLFEKHKLIFTSLLTFRILLKENKIKGDELQFLIEGKKDMSKDTTAIPRDLLNANQLASAKALTKLEIFENLLDVLSASSEQNFWRKWLNSDSPEKEDLPKSMYHLSSFQKLLVIRALRPDKITSAITNYIIEMMTEKYTENVRFNIEATFLETNQFTPMFFVLFPGIDPTVWVEKLGKQYGKSTSDNTFINIPMGEGQEDGADRALVECAEKGKWIFLQNVHLMESWIKKFENNLEKVTLTAHPEFRCFISSEPPALPDMYIIPEPIIQSCIKVANESPQDLKSNMIRAWGNFNEERLDSCIKKHEFRAILYSLCLFHSLVIGRKKFGAIGWSRNYNFNEGDLTICADVLNNYLEKYDKIPWEDLRYIYGEIMYGGHITDNWDRRTNAAYLKALIRPELLAGVSLIKNFKSPDQTRFRYNDYLKYIDERLKDETPISFFLHPNAEISYLTTQGEYLFDSVLSIQGGATNTTAATAQPGDKKKNELLEAIKKFKDRLDEKPSFKLEDIKKQVPELNPYHVVALQECERLNNIFRYLKRALIELEKGQTGELDNTEAMDELAKCIRFNKLPAAWEESAGYPSKKSQMAWFDDLLKRHDQMAEWTKDIKIEPKFINLSLLCNPMSFVTAVKQVTARKDNYPLDNVDIMTEVTNFSEEMIKERPQSGIYVSGMFLQGARWEDSNPDSQGFLTEMLPKELDPKLPVMNIIALPLQEKKARTKGYYECPVYYTTSRGQTFLFTSYLRMENEDEDPNVWVLGGVALILSTDE